LGFAVGQKLISFAAKSLNLPTLCYAPPRNPETLGILKKNVTTGTDGWIRKVPDRNRASWNLENIGFVLPCNDIRDLHVLGMTGCIEGILSDIEGDEEKYTELAKRLENCTTEFNAQLRRHDVRTEIGYTGSQQSGDSGLEAELRKWFDDCSSDDCTLILLKEKNYGMYSRIKRVADLECGKYTVCVVGSKLFDDQNSRRVARFQVMSNLALKVNMKMGGDNHWLDFAHLNNAIGSANRAKNTMVCGADVTHPSSGTRVGCPSIACVVGSVDNYFMNYPGSMRLQAGRQEVSAYASFLTELH